MEIININTHHKYYYRIMFQSIVGFLALLLLFFLRYLNFKTDGLYYYVIILFIIALFFLIILKKKIFYITNISIDNNLLFIEYYYFNRIIKENIELSEAIIDIKDEIHPNQKSYKLILKTNEHTIIQYPESPANDLKWTSELIEEVYDKLITLKDEAIKQNKLNIKQ